MLMLPLYINIINMFNQLKLIFLLHFPLPFTVSSARVVGFPDSLTVFLELQYSTSVQWKLESVSSIQMS
jgi:hypothetical protein